MLPGSTPDLPQCIRLNRGFRGINVGPDGVQGPHVGNSKADFLMSSLMKYFTIPLKSILNPRLDFDFTII
jgi:hypothetical protein